MKGKFLGNLKHTNVKWLEPAGIAALMVGLPVYLVSDALFKTAILRDNSSSFWKKWMKRLLDRWMDVVERYKGEPKRKRIISQRTCI